MNEKMTNGEKNNMDAHGAIAVTTGVSDKKIGTLKMHKREIVNNFMSGVDEKQKEQMRKKVAEKLEQIEELKKQIRVDRKDNWREGGYPLVLGLGGLFFASVYALASQFHHLSGSAANIPDLLFSLGIIGAGILPPLIYEGFAEFCYDTSDIKRHLKETKESLRELSFENIERK